MPTKQALVAFLTLLSLGGAGCAAIAQQKTPHATAPAGGHVELRCYARNMRASTLHIDLFMASAPLDEEVARASAQSQFSVPFAHGSGTAITHEGHILTAAHLLIYNGVRFQPRVLLPDPETGAARAYVSTTIAIDEAHDLAVIKIDRHFDDIARIGGEHETVPGDDFYSAGHPFELGDLVTRGYVMGIDIDVPNLGHVGMIMDARSGPGASGAGLYSARSGNLIGVMQGTRPFDINTDPTPIYDFVRWGANVREVRALLAANGVPFQDGSGSLPDCGPE